MILIIGPTGNNGAPALKKLLELGYSMRALVRSSQSAAKLPKSEKLEVFIGDINDQHSITNAMKGVSKVFATTAYSTKMVEQTKNIVAAAKVENIDHLVLLSGVGAKIDATNSTLRWLGEMEQIVKESGIDYTIVQGASFMQNFFAHAQSICEEDKIYAPAIKTRLTVVDTRDIGEVVAAIITTEGHKGTTYTVTGSEILTYQEIAVVFTEELHRKIDYVSISMDTVKDNMISMGVPIDIISALIELWEDLEEMSQPFPLSDTVKKLTGKEPRSFKEFVMDYKNLFC